MKTYTIAGIDISYESVTDEHFDGLMREYENNSADFTADVKIKCTLADNISIPEGTPIGSVNGRYWLRRNDGWASYDYNDKLDKCLASIVIDENFTNINVLLYDIKKNFNLEDKYHQFNMLGELFKFIVLFHNGIVIHSSSISYMGNGLMFSAPSETGKSTHTSLWRQYYPQTDLINDDTPAVMLKSDGIYLCGTPWSGKTGINCNKTVPLKALIFLRRGSENTMEKLSASEGFKFLINEVRTPLAGELMIKTLDIAAGVIENIPSYILRCTISREAVELVKNTVGL